MKRLSYSSYCVLLGVCWIISLSTASPYYPPPHHGPSKSSGGLRGSQVYLQDPWMHEHNYFQSKHEVGPHAHHGWGGGGGHGGGGHGHGGGHGGSQRHPESATYVQKLFPVFQFSNNLKRISHTLKALKPGKHWNSWDSAAVALFGSDGTPHHVSLQGSKQPWENDGWSHNHASHHIGHTLPKKTHYPTW